MFDIQHMESGALALELGTGDEVKAFVNKLFPNSDFSNICLQDARHLLTLHGYKVYEID